MEYLVNRLHATIFSTFNLADPLEFATNTRKTRVLVLDGDPIILPVPEDSPPNLPRIFLKSKDGKYSFGVAPNQLQINFSEPGIPEFQISDIKNKFMELLDDIIGNIQNYRSGNISRLDFTIELLGLEDNATEVVKDMYIKEMVLKHPNDISIGFSDVLVWDDIRIRAKYRIYGGEAETDKGEKRQVISFLFNIDTLSKEKYDLSKERLLSLISRTFIYISDNVNVILPKLVG